MAEKRAELREAQHRAAAAAAWARAAVDAAQAALETFGDVDGQFAQHRADAMRAGDSLPAALP